jgi:hypothetical protein
MRSPRLLLAAVLIALTSLAAHATPRPSPHDPLRLRQPVLLAGHPVAQTALHTSKAPAPSLLRTFIAIFSRSPSR